MMPKTTMPCSKEEFASLLGEGFHTSFRKGNDHPGTAEIWKLIQELPNDVWNGMIDYVVYGVSYTLGLDFKGDKQ